MPNAYENHSRLIFRPNAYENHWHLIFWLNANENHFHLIFSANANGNHSRLGVRAHVRVYLCMYGRVRYSFSDMLGARATYYARELNL